MTHKGSGSTLLHLFIFWLRFISCCDQFCLLGTKIMLDEETSIFRIGWPHIERPDFNAGVQTLDEDYSVQSKRYDPHFVNWARVENLREKVALRINQVTKIVDRVGHLQYFKILVNMRGVFPHEHSTGDHSQHSQGDPSYGVSGGHYQGATRFQLKNTPIVVGKNVQSQILIVKLHREQNKCVALDCLQQRLASLLLAIHYLHGIVIAAADQTNVAVADHLRPAADSIKIRQLASSSSLSIIRWITSITYKNTPKQPLPLYGWAHSKVEFSASFSKEQIYLSWWLASRTYDVNECYQVALALLARWFLQQGAGQISEDSFWHFMDQTFNKELSDTSKLESQIQDSSRYMNGQYIRLTKR